MSLQLPNFAHCHFLDFGDLSIGFLILCFKTDAISTRGCIAKFFLTISTSKELMIVSPGKDFSRFLDK